MVIPIAATNPLVQAADVAGRTLRRDAAERSERLIGALRRRESLRAERPGWRVVNLDLHGRNFRYRYTDNDDAHGPEGPGSPPVWAINLHGYFAGGSMYARESEILARRLGWRVVNPSLPGFGGSAALDWGELTINAFSDHIDVVRRELGIEEFVLIGHSMGGAVAIDYAARHAHDVLGLIYRDGVATPEWQDRHGLSVRILGGFLPDVAPVVDLMSAVALDTPDLLVGHLFATIKALVPDLRSNIAMVSRSTPVAAMLLHLDLTESVHRVARAGVPIYEVWGCFDRVVTPSAASGFARAAGVEVQWVPGGHSWMLARPSGQADLLTEVPTGLRFLSHLEDRYANFRRRGPLRELTAYE